MAMMTTTSKMMPPAMQRLIKGGDRSMITMSDDSALMKQVTDTHAPDGREVDVKPLLLLVEDILNRATLTAGTGPTMGSLYAENMEDKGYRASFNAVIDLLSYTIERISCELPAKALTGGEAHSTTLAICNMLAPFSWDAKLVLTLAAFAKDYGNSWLLAQTSQLTESTKILKQLPEMEQPGALESRFDALNSLIQAMLRVTRCMVDFKDLPPAYISSEAPALLAARAHVPTAVYWTIRSAVACSSEITSLTSYGLEVVSILARKLTNICEHMQKQIGTCRQHIEEKQHLEAYQTLLHPSETIHEDNVKILKNLIYPKDDILPLVEGSTKQRVDIEILRRKNVLLLISGLDISQDELAILEQIHSASTLYSKQREINQYEVVWIPVVDHRVKWTDLMQEKFEALQSTMPWYTVCHPNLINQVMIQFIQEKWHFRNKPIMVVLDPQGKVVCPNAIHMMWIWGSNAFPFTTLREESLWKYEAWRLELLVDGIDQTILDWIIKDKYIFLYGGDDIEWIRDFTAKARQVALAAEIPLEMVYVGKRSKREQVQRVIETINFEKLSYAWQDLTMVWFFWTRLESMLFSKIQHWKADEYDLLMQQIKKLLIFDKAGGWAVLSKGSSITVNGHGTTVLQALLEYDLWKEHVPTKGYGQAFKDHHDMICPSCQFRFPFQSQSTAERIPESIQCPECQVLMERLTTFVCCRDDFVPSIYE